MCVPPGAGAVAVGYRSIMPNVSATGRTPASVMLKGTRTVPVVTRGVQGTLQAQQGQTMRRVMAGDSIWNEQLPLPLKVNHRPLGIS